MSLKITSAQSFFGEKIFPYVDEVYNYSLLMTGDDRLAEKHLLNTCKEASWFSEYLSPDTDTRIWLLRIMMKIGNMNQDNHDTPDTSATEQIIDLSKFDRDCIEHKGQYGTTKIIREIISSLPFNLKQVLVLIDHLKFNYEKAADLIDVPVGTILTRLFDARKLLLLRLITESSVLITNEKSEISREEKKTIISITDGSVENDKNEPDKIKFEGEVEAQQYAKNLFEKYISLQVIRLAVKQKIVKKFAPNLKDKIDKDNNQNRRGLVTGATIVMFIFAAVLILINRPAVVNPEELAKKQRGEDNILIQLEKNYNFLIGHRFDSLMVSINEEKINKYLGATLIEYEPVILILRGWYPTDYFITKFENNKLINLVYKNSSGTILYTYQVPLDFIGKEKSLQITDDLLDYLNSENCYVTRKGDLTFLLKIMDGNVLGVAGRNLDKSLIVSVCNQKPL